MKETYEYRKKMIYDFMCEDMYVPMKIKELCIVLGVTKQDRPILEQILLELQQELLKMANAKQNYDALADEIDELRAEKEELLLQEANKDGIRQRMTDMVSFLQSEPEEVTEYSEALVRRMIEKITVYDDHFVVEFKSGIEITINE